MEIVIQSVGPTNFSKESPKFLFYEIWLYKYKNNYKIKLKKKKKDSRYNDFQSDNNKWLCFTMYDSIEGWKSNLNGALG